MDDGRVGDDMTMEELAKEFRLRFGEARQTLESMEQKFDAIDQRFDAIDQRLDAMDQKFESKIDSLDARVRIGFEETHRLIKMGFESVQILDEKIDRRFNETERQHADHRILIEAAIKHIGRDVEQRPVRRRVSRPRKADS